MTCLPLQGAESLRIAHRSMRLAVNVCVFFASTLLTPVLSFLPAGAIRRPLRIAPGRKESLWSAGEGLCAGVTTRALPNCARQRQRGSGCVQVQMAWEEFFDDSNVPYYHNEETGWFRQEVGGEIAFLVCPPSDVICPGLQE